MTHYTQLTQVLRYQISAYMKAGFNQTEIATMIGVHKSNISREIRRNCGGRGYRPQQAHQTALNRRQDKVSPRICPKTWRLIEHLLRKDWSPEQISGWRIDEKQPAISPEWIYQHVLADKQAGGLLYQHLRC